MIDRKLSIYNTIHKIVNDLSSIIKSSWDEPPNDKNYLKDEEKRC